MNFIFHSKHNRTAYSCVYVLVTRWQIFTCWTLISGKICHGYPSLKFNVKFSSFFSKTLQHSISITTAHCSYLNIYISRKIRLCVVDLESQFQTTLQTKYIKKFTSLACRVFELCLPNQLHIRPKHYFGLGTITKLTDTFSWYHSRYQNHILKRKSNIDSKRYFFPS